MRFPGNVLVLLFIVFAVPLNAQQTGTGTGISDAGSSGGFSENSSFQGIENASEQASSSGGFVGGGRPSAFAGIDAIYSGSTASTRSTASRSSRSVTSSRSTASRSSTSRRTATQAGGARSTMSRSNNQYVRATASIDFDVPRVQFSERRMSGMIEANLQRMRGIQNSQITFKNSPVGTTAVLKGTVASERERRVAQQLVLLEPGISQVENLLEVTSEQR